MKTQIINHAQGTEAWHKHRAQHLNASDAAALLGLSSYKTRTQLLHEKATGFTAEVDAATQQRFTKGHEFEAIARPWAEEIIGSELFPVVLAGEYEGLNLSASLDGVDMASEFTFEHKSGRADLLASLERKVIPDEYHPQMEMGLMLSGASKCLFMASSGDKDAMRFGWYEAKPELRAQIIAAWHQFNIDLAAYVPPVITVAPSAKLVSSLPVVFDMRVEGKLVSCNIEQYKPAALAYINAINIKLDTDQSFVDADADAKFCRESADKLELAIEQAMGQMGDINQALNTVREIAAAFDAKGLALEKLVKAEKENRRTAIVGDAVAELVTHVKKLNDRLGKPYMPSITGDFQGVIKGLKSLDSMKDKVATELARCKIEANAMADRIQVNLVTLRELASEHTFLFADTAQLVGKENDDLTALVKSRIADHKAAEAAKEEAQRERIRAEEEARATRLAKEEQDRLAREAKETEEILIASIWNNARRIEFDSAPYIQKAIGMFETGAKDWENDPRPRVATAVAEARSEMKAKLVAAQEREQADQPASAPAPAANVLPMRPAPHAAAPSTPPTLKLGQISERLAPLNITAECLRTLGFNPAARIGASVMFHEATFPFICAALIAHIQHVQAKQATL